MNPTNESSTFFNTPGHNNGATSLAGLLAPVQCVLKPISSGWEMRLNGLGVRDILPVLSVVDDSERMNILLAPQPGEAMPLVSLPGKPEPANGNSNRVLRWAVCVDGPIEPVDAFAIEQALAEGGCPLEAELRATWVIELLSGGALSVRARSEDAILSVAGEVLRKYASSRCRQDDGAIEPPDPGLIHGLLSHTGSFTIRPIETESYSTWIDIGFSTCPRRSVKPADRSLIYDMIGNSWHGDF